MAAGGSILRFLKTTLVGGLFVVLPVWLSVLLVLKSLSMMEVFVKPVASNLPEQARHPRVLAVLLLLLGCFVVGLLVKTTVGRWVQASIERNVLNRVPGYRVIQSVSQQLGHAEQGKGFAPALVELEDALVPAFVVERHPDGRCTVFVPAAPTPAIGSIYIMTSERVHPIDAPLMTMVRCISKWGTGSGELLTAMRPGSAPSEKEST